MLHGAEHAASRSQHSPGDVYRSWRQQILRRPGERLQGWLTAWDSAMPQISASESAK